MSRRASPTIPLPIRCSWPTAAMDRCTASRAPTSRRSTLSSLAPTPTTSASTPRPAAWSSVTATAPSPWSRPRQASRRPRSGCPATPSPFSSSAAARGSLSTCRTRIRSPWWIGPPGEQVASWGLADAQANFPMALNEADGRLAVGYREPALLAVFNTGSGAPVARVPACGDTDDVFLDRQAPSALPQLRRGLSSRSSSSAMTLTRNSHAFRPSRARAPRCSFRSAIGLYLAVRASGSEGAAVWVFRTDAVAVTKPARLDQGNEVVLACSAAAGQTRRSDSMMPKACWEAWRADVGAGCSRRKLRADDYDAASAVALGHQE